MITVKYDDYITLYINDMPKYILSFEDLKVDPSNFPERIQLLDRNGDVYDTFELTNVSYDVDGIVRSVLYSSAIDGRSGEGEVVGVYNVEYNDDID